MSIIHQSTKTNLNSVVNELNFVFDTLFVSTMANNNE